MRMRLGWQLLVVGAGLGLLGAGAARAQGAQGLGGYSGTYGAPGVNQPGLPGMVAPGGLAAPQTGTLPPGASTGYSPSANAYVYGSYPSLNPGIGPGVMPSTGVTGPYGAPALGLGITQDPLQGSQGLGQPGSTGLGGLTGNPGFGGATGSPGGMGLGGGSPLGSTGATPSGPVGAGGGR